MIVKNEKKLMIIKKPSAFKWVPLLCGKAVTLHVLTKFELSIINWKCGSWILFLIYIEKNENKLKIKRIQS